MNGWLWFARDEIKNLTCKVPHFGRALCVRCHTLMSETNLKVGCPPNILEQLYGFFIPIFKIFWQISIKIFSFFNLTFCELFCPNICSLSPPRVKKCLAQMKFLGQGWFWPLGSLESASELEPRIGLLGIPIWLQTPFYNEGYYI